MATPVSYGFLLPVIANAFERVWFIPMGVESLPVVMTTIYEFGKRVTADVWEC
jgi:hypothetical protein